MRHRKASLQFNRFTSWRRATLNSLVRSLLKYQSIRTTQTKAKAARSVVERLISIAKDNSLSSRRRAFKMLQDHALVNLLFNDVAQRFKDTNSGFTRIINLRQRRGDGARMAILELTQITKKEVVKPKKQKEAKPEHEQLKPQEATAEKPVEEEKPASPTQVKEKPPATKKPQKKFLGGLRGIFKKERDAL